MGLYNRVSGSTGNETRIKEPKPFKEFISGIYPKELTISETTESTSVASYLDLLFT